MLGFRRLFRRMRTFLFEDEPPTASIADIFAQLPDEKLQNVLFHYFDEHAMPTQTTPASTVHRERHTDGISERAIDNALKNQGKTPTTEKVEAVQCGALGVDMGKLRRTGDLVRWYHDKHRTTPMSDETMEIRAARWRQS